MQSVYFDRQIYIKTLKAARKKRAALKHQKTKSDGKKKRLWIMAAAGAVCLAAVIILGFALRPGTAQIEAILETGKFAGGVSVDGVEISGLTMDEARAALADETAEKLESTEFSFEFNGTQYTKTAGELGVTTNLDTVLENAMLSDKSQGLFLNLSTKLDIRNSGRAFETELSADTDTIAPAIASLAETLITAPTEPRLVFDENAANGDYITWEEGVDGAALDETDMLDRITQGIADGETDLGTVNAVLTAPNETAQTLSENVVKISEYTTSFYGVTLSEEKRVSNIVKMADYINGSVIAPNEVWSFNDCSGERTEAGGWQLAKTLYGGVLVEEMGGGVCQVSTTVYNAFLLAELGVVERHAHSKPSTYVPIGLDATVDYGVKDLKIINTLEDTVYLVVQVDTEKKTITASVYGPKPDHNYQVIVRALIWQSNIEPEEAAQVLVAEGGYAPDGTYVAPGTKYAYPATTLGSRYKTYRYYYPLDFNDETDDPYSWVGYEKGDNASGEKISVQYYTEDGTGKDIVTYYPPIAGTYYINPKDAN